MLHAHLRTKAEVSPNSHLDFGSYVVSRSLVSAVMAVALASWANAGADVSGTIFTTRSTGYTDTGPSIDVENGGTIQSDNVELATNPGDFGSVSISGAGTQWVNSDTFAVGGTYLSLTSGGQASVSVETSALLDAGACHLSTLFGTDFSPQPRSATKGRTLRCEQVEPGIGDFSNPARRFKQVSARVAVECDVAVEQFVHAFRQG